MSSFLKLLFWYHNPHMLIIANVKSMLFVAVLGHLVSLYGTYSCFCAYYEQAFNKPYLGMTNHLFFSFFILCLALASMYLELASHGLDIMLVTLVYAA
jgi:hypothetical protein